MIPGMLLPDMIPGMLLLDMIQGHRIQRKILLLLSGLQTPLDSTNNKVYNFLKLQPKDPLQPTQMLDRSNQFVMDPHQHTLRQRDTQTQANRRGMVDAGDDVLSTLELTSPIDSYFGLLLQTFLHLGRHLQA